MRKWITLLMACLVVGPSLANATMGQIDFEAGYRRDNISWKLRVPAKDPLVTSSHHFRDLDIFQLGLTGRTTIGCNLYVRGNAYWGWILDGEYKRTVGTHLNYYDYSDFQFGISAQKKTVVDDKYVYGINAAIGYPFFFCDCTAIVAPVVGYAFDEQSLRFDHSCFDISDSDLDLSVSEHPTRQTFNNRWYGPFVGLDFNYRPCGDCWNVYADIEYHWGAFRGRRSDGDGFSLFDHSNRSSRDARGWVIATGAEYDMGNCWTIGFSLKFQDRAANRAHRVCADSEDNKIFGSKHGSYCKERQKANHKWNSYAINLTLGRDF